ncbi:MAG: sulfite exporter TauE/SafE family protein [Rhodospirillales bacterium]|jgi:uncharacterized membrane protein YfcA
MCLRGQALVKHSITATQIFEDKFFDLNQPFFANENWLQRPLHYLGTFSLDHFIDLFVTSANLTLWQFILLCGVSLLGSFLTAALGLGGGTLTIATMALIMPPTVLVPLHAFIQLGSNFGRAALLYRHILYGVLPVFIAGSVIGILIGGKVVITLPLYLLQGILALFIIYSTWAPKFVANKPKKSTFFFASLIGAFTTMFVGATGPIVAPFALAASEIRHQFVATHASFMTIHHSLKLVAFGFLGFAFGPYIPLLIALLLFGFVGTYLGKIALNHLNEDLFRVLLKAVLTILAGRLMYDALQSAML